MTKKARAIGVTEFVDDVRIGISGGGSWNGKAEVTPRAQSEVIALANRAFGEG